jgi:hypothetical protein
MHGSGGGRRPARKRASSDPTIICPLKFKCTKNGVTEMVRRLNLILVMRIL